MQVPWWGNGTQTTEVTTQPNERKSAAGDVGDASPASDVGLGLKEKEKRPVSSSKSSSSKSEKKYKFDKKPPPVSPLPILKLSVQTSFFAIVGPSYSSSGFSRVCSSLVSCPFLEVCPCFKRLLSPLYHLYLFLIVTLLHLHSAGHSIREVRLSWTPDQ